MYGCPEVIVNLFSDEEIKTAKKLKLPINEPALCFHKRVARALASIEVEDHRLDEGGRRIKVKGRWHTLNEARP